MDKKTARKKANTIVEQLSRQSPKYIVAIGASAGGLDAIKILFDKMPKNLEAAYVVIQHLSPDFDSVMDEILERETRFNVETVSDNLQVKANTVYVMKKRQSLTIAADHFIVSDNELSHPIDIFFKSLAQDRLNSAVGIILSGSGTDGSLGVQHLHSAGSLVIAQEPSTCAFSSMPESAIETQSVDYIMPPHQIGSKLKEYFKQHNYSQNLVHDKEISIIFSKIFDWLKSNSDVDFSAYKTSTVERRISHRMSVLGLDSLAEYLEFITRDSKETNALTNDLFIGVTEFFRDQKSWQMLSEQVLKPMLLENAEGSSLRFWCLGCSTGEEPYSLAIILQQAMDELSIDCQYKIFATDINPQAIRKASEGRYSISQLNGVNKSILKEFFTLSEDEYVIKDLIRDNLVFTRHNILDDPPFSRINLIICRNMLIYFQPSAQDKIMSSIHFSLIPDGYLMLGLSESTASMKDFYFTLDAKNKLFQKNPDKQQTASRLSFYQRNLERAPYKENEKGLRRKTQPPFVVPHSTEHDIKERLFESFIPPTVVLDQNHKIIYCFGNTNKFTKKITSGAFSTHFSKILHNSILQVLETSLTKVSKSKKRLVLSDVVLLESKVHFSIDIRYFPLSEKNDNELYTITFGPALSNSQLKSPTKPVTLNAKELQDCIDQRDEELVDARLIISKKQGDINSMSEELQTSNEELMASNEELQSTNEELHSVNEELFTVNAELQEKIKQLESANNDLDSILALTSVGVVYLDNHFRIRRFTSEIRRYIKLLAVDISRPLSDVSSEIDDLLLEKWLKTVKHTLKPMTQLTTFIRAPEKKVKVVISPSFDRKQNATGIIVMFDEVPLLDSNT